MAKTRSANLIEHRGDHSVLIIDHKATRYEVPIDNADVSVVLEHRWSIGRGCRGYLFIQTSAWTAGRGQQTIRLSRYLLGVADRNVVIDHIDRNPLNMRRSNLRAIPSAGNRQNRGADSRNHVGIRGVHERDGRFRARVHLNGTIHNLGVYSTTEEAAEVVSQFRREHMPYAVEPQGRMPL